MSGFWAKTSLLSLNLRMKILSKARFDREEIDREALERWTYTSVPSQDLGMTCLVCGNRSWGSKEVNLHQSSGLWEQRGSSFSQDFSS